MFRRNSIVHFFHGGMVAIVIIKVSRGQLNLFMRCDLTALLRGDPPPVMVDLIFCGIAANPTTLLLSVVVVQVG